jgi:hypothetical protein
MRGGGPLKYSPTRDYNSGFLIKRNLHRERKKNGTKAALEEFFLNQKYLTFCTFGYRGIPTM